MGISYDEYWKVVHECIQLSKDKNELYGTRALIRFDKLGVLIRMNDKIDRLNNIYMNEKKVKFESVEDNLKDLINYAIYHILILRGKITKGDNGNEPEVNGNGSLPKEKH